MEKAADASRIDTSLGNEIEDTPMKLQQHVDSISLENLKPMFQQLDLL